MRRVVAFFSFFIFLDSEAIVKIRKPGKVIVTGLKLKCCIIYGLVIWGEESSSECINHHNEWLQSLLQCVIHKISCPSNF